MKTKKTRGRRAGYRKIVVRDGVRVGYSEKRTISKRTRVDEREKVEKTRRRRVHVVKGEKE